MRRLIANVGVGLVTVFFVNSTVSLPSIKESEKESGVKRQETFYEPCDQNLKELLETFTIRKNQEENIQYPQFDTFYVARPSFIQKGENGYWNFDINVVPKRVSISYISRYPYGKGHDELIEVTLGESIAVKLNYEDNSSQETLRPVLETRTKVKLSWFLGVYTEEQKQALLDAVKNQKPLRVKGTLMFHLYGDSLEKVKQHLEEWGLEIRPKTINDLPIDEELLKP